ncbi:MAG: hypothetical protein PHQ46_11975 [Negativicutes bacterium]|nr:hypothetical protein [Negativicutes bacterium]
MRKSSKKASLAVAAMLVGSIFCTPAFAAAPDSNTATYGAVVVDNWENNNEVTGVGEQVFDSYDNNTAKAVDVTTINGTATIPQNYSDVTAIGARVGTSHNWNTAEVKGDVKAENYGSGISGIKNEVFAVGSQILGSGINNTATMAGDVSAYNEGKFSNVTAIGTAIVDSKDGNKAIMGYSDGSVMASNHGQGLELINPANGVHDAGLNNVLAYGAGISESGYGNTANTNQWVAAHNWGTYANDVTSIGTLVSGSGDYNTATTQITFAETWPTGALDSYAGNFNNNTVIAYGAQVIDSDNYNTATSNFVRNDMVGANNTVAAIGAQVLNSGSYNNAFGGDVTVKSVGNNNTVTAIGAQISKTVKKANS